MENATKALLIAAAVLVAILIISLGLVVYNMAAETMDSVNISGQEVTASNEKFTRYDGSHRRGSEVNAMLKTVLSANRDAEEAGEEAKIVEVTGDVTLSTGATSLSSRADTSKLYTISVNFGGPGGLVDKITVTAE